MIQLNRTVAAGASRVGVFDLSGRRDDDGADHVCVPRPSTNNHFATHTKLAANNSERSHHFRAQRTYQRPPDDGQGTAGDGEHARTRRYAFLCSTMHCSVLFETERDRPQLRIPSSIRPNLHPCMYCTCIITTNAHWPAFGGPTSASEAPHPALTAAPLLHTLPAPACPPASSHNNNERRPGSSSTFRPRLRRRLSEPSVSRHLIESNKLFAGPYPITSRPPPEPSAIAALSSPR